MKDKIIKFEKFLGKTINDILKIKTIEVKNNSFNKLNNSVITELKIDSKLFNSDCSLVQVLQNNNKIQLISIFFISILNEKSLNILVENYSCPNSISKIDKLIYENDTIRSEEKGYNQELTKREFSLKEVLFNEEPDFILWKKDKYQIEIRFDYKNKLTRIAFIKPT